MLDKGKIFEFKSKLREEEQYARCIELMDNGEHAKAAECFDEMIERSPDDIFAYYGKALSLNLSGEWGKALQVLNDSFSVNSTEIFGSILKAEILRDHGKLEMALRIYDVLIDSYPSDEDAFYRKASVLEEMGNTNDALDCYNEILIINPNSRIALEKLGREVPEPTEVDDEVQPEEPTVDIEAMPAEDVEYQVDGTQTEESLTEDVEKETPGLIEEDNIGDVQEELAWEPLPPKEHKKALKAAQKEIKPLDKDLKKGRITQDEYDRKCEQLMIKHGLQEPVIVSETDDEEPEHQMDQLTLPEKDDESEEDKVMVFRGVGVKKASTLEPELKDAPDISGINGDIEIEEEPGEVTELEPEPDEPDVEGAEVEPTLGDAWPDEVDAEDVTTSDMPYEIPEEVYEPAAESSGEEFGEEPFEVKETELEQAPVLDLDVGELDNGEGVEHSEAPDFGPIFEELEDEFDSELDIGSDGVIEIEEAEELEEPVEDTAAVHRGLQMKRMKETDEPPDNGFKEARWRDIAEQRRASRSAVSLIGIFCIITIAVYLMYVSIIAIYDNFIITLNFEVLLPNVLLFALGFGALYGGISVAKNSIIFDHFLDSIFESEVYPRLEPALEEVAEVQARLEGIDERIERMNLNIARSRRRPAVEEFPSLSIERKIAMFLKFVVIINISIGILLYTLSFPGRYAPYIFTTVFMIWWLVITEEFKLWKIPTAWAWAILPIFTVPVMSILLYVVINIGLLIGLIGMFLSLYAYGYFVWSRYYVEGVLPFGIHEAEATEGKTGKS